MKRAIALVGLLSVCAVIATPLNLLLITADDMNADSVSWMGNTVVRTPNVDAFTATGHRFVNNNVTAPICQPSRSAIMTGRVPHRNGALGFEPVNEDVPTLMEVLKAQGYYLAIMNKSPHTAVKSVSPWDWIPSASGKNPTKLGADTAQAIANAAAAHKPFFINCNMTDPHRPFYGSAEGGGSTVIEPLTPREVTVPSFLEEVPTVHEEVTQYYSSIRRLDLSFGLIMKALTDSGQENNTVVLFLSDHGMSFPFSKATLYRNGTWSPAALRWPGMGAPQRRLEVTSSVDIMPTLLEVLQIPAPEGMDGRSWLPLLAGEMQADRDFVVTHVNTVSSGVAFPGRCIRTLTRSLMFEAWSDGATAFKVEAMTGLSYSGMAAAAPSDTQLQSRVDQYIKGVPLQFFDLELDPDERVNRIEDPAYAEEVELMKQRLLEHMQRTDDPQTDNFIAVANLPP